LIIESLIANRFYLSKASGHIKELAGGPYYLELKGEIISE